MWNIALSSFILFLIVEGSEDFCAESDSNSALSSPLKSVTPVDLGCSRFFDTILSNDPEVRCLQELGSGTEGTTHSQISSSISSPSNHDSSKFVAYDDFHYRPHGSSLKSHTTPAAPRKRVSFGWVQFSDDRVMPSEDMLDTPENREHIRVLMLADARHGNLEYFRYLVGVLQRLDARCPTTVAMNSREMISFELSCYNPNSMIFAALYSDNVDLFTEVMAFKGLSLAHFNPLEEKSSPGGKDDLSPHPPKRTHFLDIYDDDDDDDDETLCSIEETVFGQAIIRNSIEIVRFLIEKGLRDNYPAGSETALHLAIRYGHEIISRILLEQAGSQLEKINGALLTPLMTAITYGHPRIVQFLIDAGACFTAFDHNHRNILHHAAIRGDLEILKVLDRETKSLSSGDLNFLKTSLDLKRNSPLQLASNEAVFAFLTDRFGVKP